MITRTTTTQEKITMKKLTATDKIRAAMAARPGMTTPEVALAAGVGRSTATELLNKWLAAGTVRRETDRDGKAAVWSAVDVDDAPAVDDAPDLTADEQAWVRELGDVDMATVNALVAAVEQAAPAVIAPPMPPPAVPAAKQPRVNKVDAAWQAAVAALTAAGPDGIRARELFAIMEGAGLHHEGVYRLVNHRRHSGELVTAAAARKLLDRRYALSSLRSAAPAES